MSGFAWFWMPMLMFFVFMSMSRRRWRRGMGPWGWDPMGWNEPRGRERPVEADPEERRRREQQDAQIEQLEGRVAELESRLDFAERLLATRRDAAAVPQGPAQIS